MTKTQVQLPDRLYQEAKRVAREREISLAEVIRRGVEYVTRVYPPVSKEDRAWLPPKPHRLGGFRAPLEEWRLLANERFALTLRHHGVTELATANERDFKGFGFKKVWNPLQLQ